MVVRLNIGCGQSPTPGWQNYDNSPALWLARSRLLMGLMRRLGLIDAANVEFAEFCRSADISYADAATRIPHDTGSVDVIYSSHMIEHLDRHEAKAFLAECRRVLKSGGILRLAVPDLRNAVEQYLALDDADGFVRVLQFDLDKPRGFAGRLRRLAFGGRGHHWMYDSRSLSTLLSNAGFTQLATVSEASTRIPDPGALDLHEREGETVCIEAIQP